MRLRAFAVIVACSLFACLHAQSRTAKQPSPSTPQGTPEHTDQAAEDPDHAKALREISAELRAIREQAARYEQQRATAKTQSGPPIWSNWALVVIGGLTVVAAIKTLRALNRQVAESIKATAASQISANAAKASADGLKNAERAYVGIRERWSGAKMPQPDPFRQYKANNPNRYRLDIRIVNSGRTPASIDGGMIQCVRDLDAVGFNDALALPNDKSRISGDFLHAGNRSRQTLILDVSTEAIEALASKSVWLIGFVDYKDAFKTRHRAGYCRRLSRKKDSTTITLFVDTSCEPYNYDDEIDEHGNRKAKS